MRILWLSNCSLVGIENKGTGSWLFSMAKALNSKNIQLYNITQSAYARKLQKKQGHIEEWILPRTKLINGLPPQSHINLILGIVNEIKPDIIHIWGIESYWGLLSARGYLKGKILLEIQGLYSSCAEVYYGGMNFNEILQTFGLKEILAFNRSLIYKKWLAHGKLRYEKEILSAHKYISVQSEWVKARISPYISDDTELLDTGIIVRDEFYECEAWKYKGNDNPIVFAMSSGGIAYKGVHVLLKSLFLLKKQYPGITLHLAGNFQQNQKFYKKGGYIKFLEKLIKKFRLKVVFLGSLNASELICEMKKCDVMVQPSFVESYSLALAEAMSIGIPCVVSYAGAMTELAIDNETALFYSPMDYYKCAYQVNRLLESKDLSNELSRKSKDIAYLRNKSDFVINTQLKIYRKICNQN